MSRINTFFFLNSVGTGKLISLMREQQRLWSLDKAEPKILYTKLQAEFFNSIATCSVFL